MLLIWFGQSIKLLNGDLLNQVNQLCLQRLDFSLHLLTPFCGVCLSQGRGQAVGGYNDGKATNFSFWAECTALHSSADPNHSVKQINTNQKSSEKERYSLSKFWEVFSVLEISDYSKIEFFTPSVYFLRKRLSWTWVCVVWKIK